MMLVKDIMPLIEDDVFIWIQRNKGGRWTMPRKDIIKSDGEKEVIKIDVGSSKEYRRKEYYTITLYVD